VEWKFNVIDEVNPQVHGLPM